ncbi:MAG TPA: type I glyceraldehyde-3-phosphate dehydrogenase [Candidatus Polarisedimenticolaceae bacterium]|nr:type I glyceraldehyde-3-phosphate dehydrogenase [Candidatus Polarisedimenticolaceae bacterium]
MTAVRVGINGMGRIGRAVLRQIADRDDVEVAAVNDLVDLGELAYMLQYDSVHGRFGPVETRGSHLVVRGQEIAVSSHRTPEDIPWRDAGAEVVIESTGAFRARSAAAGHLQSGAERVILSAPSDDADLTVVLGVNERAYDPARHRVVSMASCTTNCLAPMVKVLHEEFSVEVAVFTTIHAYTSSQSLVDGPARKRPRGRAAALSIIPTTTGAAQAAERVLPELAGRIHGMAMRVPVPDGSVTDLVARLGREVTAEEVNGAFRSAASRREWQGILGVSDERLVSADIVGDPRSALIDAPNTQVSQGRTTKVLAWYDNEWGYAARLVDFAVHVSGKGSAA